MFFSQQSVITLKLYACINVCMYVSCFRGKQDFQAISIIPIFNPQFYWVPIFLHFFLPLCFLLWNTFQATGFNQKNALALSSINIIFAFWFCLFIPALNFLLWNLRGGYSYVVRRLGYFLGSKFWISIFLGAFRKINIFGAWWKYEYFSW